MVGYITKPAAEINAALVEFLPELDSEYAKYPMKHKRWYDPNETGPKGEPCFFIENSPSTSPTRTAEGIKNNKKDYVYCTNGPNGKGYYSLMCRISYVNLHRKLKSSAPQGSCAGCPCFASKATRMAMDRYDDCRRVIYMRQLCTQLPDDQIASDIVMGRAKATAQMVYNGTQNAQLVINAVL